jgi:hypothetical protein
MITISVMNNQGQMMSSMRVNERVVHGRAAGLLSSLDSYSVDVFSSEEMPAIISELNEIAPKDNTEVSSIISLARLCQSTSGSTLVFSPFGVKKQ